MRVALIPPISLMESIPRTDMHLLLPHLWKEETYRNFYTQVSGWKIVDNGAAEHIRMPLCHVVKIFDEAGSDEFVSPDFLGDSEGTVEATWQAKEYRSRQIMGVAQGSTIHECGTTIQRMSRFSWITSIALPRHIVNTTGDIMARVKLAHYAEAYGFTRVHCLGSSMWPEEVKLLVECPFINSIDTSAPIAMALQGLKLEENYEHHAGKGYFDANPDSRAEQLAIDNCKQYLEWAQAS